jgi:hypothetical protein
MAKKSKSPREHARVVLEGVPRVNFYDGGERCPEDVPFPSCLRACLEFMGENLGCKHIKAEGSTWRLGCAYAYLMGTSGSAFRLSWGQGWQGDNVEIMYMSADPDAPFRRAFESVGYAHESVMKEEDRDNEAYFRSRIIESIRDKGRPVLGFGVIGPPECCIITGYDNHGNVLIGWNFFQNFPEFDSKIEFEPSGYFRKQDWFKDTEGLIIIGEKQEKPSLNEIYRDALKWALEVVRTPMPWKNRYNGLAAYAAWADALMCDDEFIADDMAVLRERHMVHDDAVGTVAEGRWYGALFLMRIAEHIPAMSVELLEAASCYAAEHDLMWQIWNLVGGIGRSDEHVKKLAEPDVRRQIVPIIFRARDKDAEAADHIERALAKWKGDRCARMVHFSGKFG